MNVSAKNRTVLSENRRQQYSPWKKGVIFMTCLSMLASITGCTKTPGGKTESFATLPQHVITPTGEFVQQPAVRDYSYLWWKDGFAANSGAGQLNIQTGYYGLALRPIQGQITKIGAIAEEVTQEDAGREDNSRIEALSVVDKMSYQVTLDGKTKKLSEITPINSAVARSANDTAVSRVIESGRYMQCVDIMNLEFSGEYNLSGRVEIAAMPQYLSVDFSLWSKTADTRSAGLSWSMTLGESYTAFERTEDGRVITAKEASGSGLTFVLPETDGASMALDEASRTLTFTLDGLKLKKQDFTGMNFIIIPSTAAALTDAQTYYRNQAAEGSAVQIHPKEGREQQVSFNSKGYLSISLNNMLTWSGQDFTVEERQDEMDRLTFTIKNPSDKAIKIPVQFLKANRLSVLGCSPLLRDAETGEPIGVQVQLSKNWHEPVDFAADDPATYLAGTWFHGYTLLEVPAGSSVTYEFCMTYAKWGGVYAASHSQLCLAGWGGNYQQWESSAIGSFGESFCYEAEMTHGRGYITDIRPLLVNSIYGGKYFWTENIGGGNFLHYTKNGNTSPVTYKQVRTQFRKQGPNLTEVIYRGVTTDGKIAYEYIANLPRTNDVSRAYHTFRYTFLEDVAFDRLAFYQFGSDNYNDNHWDTMAVGNDTGTVSLDIGGKTYSGDFALPVMDKADYVGGKGMQRIDIPGEGLWMAFMGYEPVLWKKTPGANRMLNVISYNATLNGKTYTKPSLSFYHTMNGGVPCIAVELSPPAEAGNTIKKGSTVEGTVEWLNMPVSKSDYYGPSEIMNSFDASAFNTSKIAYAYAQGGKYRVTAEVGTVTKQTPIYVACAEKQDSGQTAAEITVTGGMGYVPITFSNVKHYSGYRLEQYIDGGWVKVDQSTYGNDFWQTWYDSNTCTYEFTYNIEHSGNTQASYRYRLVKN